jgi:hypothetical protein
MTTAAVLLAAWLAAGPADPAATGSVEFRWDAPAEHCPTEAEVLAQLERLLGGKVSEQGDRRLAAIARVRREADGRWDLRLWTVANDSTSERSMTGEDCAVLAEAAALLAAIAIDPSVLVRGDASEAAVEQAEQAETVAEAEPVPEVEPPALEQSTTEPPAPEPPQLEPRQAEPPQPEPARRQRRFVVGTGASAGISYGDLPGVGPIIRLGVALQWPHARVELEGHYGFLRRARFEDGEMIGADLRHGMVVARGCGVLHARAAKLEFPICGGLEGGALVGHGVGFTVIEDGQLPWLAIDVAAGLAWAPIRRLAIGLRVEPWVAMVRGRFTAEQGATELWRPQPLGVRAVVGLEARF